jgi:hypothetical protein
VALAGDNASRSADLIATLLADSRIATVLMPQIADSRVPVGYSFSDAFLYQLREMHPLVLAQLAARIGCETVTELAPGEFDDDAAIGGLSHTSSCNTVGCGESLVSNPRLKCSRCGCAYYCGKACQLADWSARHRVRCSEIVDRFMCSIVSEFKEKVFHCYIVHQAA